MKKNKGFTIIELIVVLVILAVIFLITVPIVLNIIDKTTISSRKRSVDGYGKAIELAQSTYKLENGFYTYNFDELNVKYTGTDIECEEIVLNENGSVFLSKCKIDDEYIEDEDTIDGYYQYGRVIYEYNVGDLITYNNVDYYVIRNSEKSSKYITLLKAEPITTKEAKEIIPSTELKDTIIISQSDKYLSMQYLYHEQCISAGDTSGCTNDYAVSSIKQVVDVWTNYYTNEFDLVKDELGYKSRLITFEELAGDLGYKKTVSMGYESYNIDDANAMYEILKTSNQFFTMSSYEDSSYDVWTVGGGSLGSTMVANKYYVRPVINVKKEVIY